jgi:hypothetical protein
MTSGQSNLSTSVYGEIGKLWSSGGNAKIESSVQGSLGVRVLVRPILLAATVD